MNDYVVLKGKKDRLVIQLAENIDFITLKDKFSLKIKEAETFIGEAKIAVEFTGRKLSEKEENELIKVINESTKIDVVFVFSENSIFTEIPEQVKSFVEKKDVADEGVTKFYKGTLRSGSEVNFKGNVVILGDVNPGAVVRAEGNVIVLGYLNGTVCAGVDSGADAFVGAFSLNPIQIRIGDVIAKNPTTNILEINKVKKTADFEVAYLKDKQIYIERFSKATLEKMVRI